METITIKRLLDILASALGLLVLAPVFGVIAVLVKLDDGGPAFFTQNRLGKDFIPFTFYKFRSMVVDAPELGPPVTAGGDQRVTRLGVFLRRTKLDELPQLFNVLKGDISLVGPRPEAEKYVSLLKNDYREILSIKPGITDLATIEYRDEEEILARYDDPEQGYIEEILPRKITLSKRYMREQNLCFDCVIIVKTLLRILRP